jgi:hypothetical protein
MPSSHSYGYAAIGQGCSDDTEEFWQRRVYHQIDIPWEAPTNQFSQNGFENRVNRMTGIGECQRMQLALVNPHRFGKAPDGRHPSVGCDGKVHSA